MSNNYLKKANNILKNLNINVKDINTKTEIKESKNFIATFTPSIKKIIIK